jgi:hypothetical protein
MLFSSDLVESALTKTVECLGISGLDLSNHQFKGSHLCYRPKTIDSYTDCVNQLNANTNVTLLVTETAVGRPISWYRFIDNVPSNQLFEFRFLEVPSPKESHQYNEQITHAAFTLHPILSIGDFMILHSKLKWITDKKDEFGIVELHFSDFQLKFHKDTVPSMLGFTSES